MKNSITLQQPIKGYRYGIDSFLLARFAKFKKTDHVCDLGAGVGILALLALTRGRVEKAVAIEIQEGLAKLAWENAEMLGVEDRLEFFIDNWKNIKKILKSHQFSLVISNPPYRKAKTGKVSPDRSKAIAKHEIEGSLPDLIQTAKYLIHPTGRFVTMYPPLRLEELIQKLARDRFKIERMQAIHAYPDRPATLVMVEAVKSIPRELKVEPPLIVYRDPDHYTAEVESWVGPKRKV
jgi:tRNA1Val (adenine37-N6)-methyltransferase